MNDHNGTTKDAESNYSDIAIQNAFWILPIMQVLGKPRGYARFLETKGISQSAAFSGFKLFVQQVIHDYSIDMELDTFLNLSQDEIARRAFWMEIDSHKYSSRSEKAHLVRNLKLMFEDLGKCRTLDAFSDSFSILERKFLEPLSAIFEESVEVDKEINSDKNSVLNVVGAFHMLNRANRTITSLVPPELLFEGLRIYGDDSSDQARRSKLHRRKEFQFLGYKATLAYILNALLTESITTDEIMMAKDWSCLIPLLVRAEDKAAEKIEDRSGRGVSLGKFFRRASQCHKNRFGEMILASPRPIMTLEDRISETLLWYPVELVNSSSMIFCGASSFRSLLVGEISERCRNNANSKVTVIRFVHPDGAPSFSYAILIERFGTISDLSGWLVFFEVAGDYQGLGGFEYKRTEETIVEYENNIEVSNFEVAAKDLRRFLESKTRTEVEELRSRLISLENSRSMMVGRLIEFVTKLFYELQGYSTKLNFNNKSVLQNKKEIDLLATDDSKKEIILIECSTTISANIDEFIDEMNLKFAAIRSHPSFVNYSSYRKVFVTTRRSIRTMRSWENVLAKLLASKIDVLEIDEIVSKRLPRNFRREDLLKCFQGDKDYLEDSSL